MNDSQISQLEHLHTDTAALMALCEKTQNDMRSCINTLQVGFFETPTLSLIDIKNSILNTNEHFFRI